MTYPRPTHRHVPGVHYRPIWAEEAAAAPVRPRVTMELLKAAFPELSLSQLQRIRLLHASGDEPVEGSVFGLDYAAQQRALAKLKAMGLTCEPVRNKGYRLTTAGREALRVALEKVPG